MIKTLVAVLATFIVTVAITPAAFAQGWSEYEGRRVSAHLRAQGRRVMRDSERGWRYRSGYHGNSYYDGYSGYRSGWSGRRGHHRGDLGDVVDIAERIAIPYLAYRVGEERGRRESRTDRSEDSRELQYDSRREQAGIEEERLTDENSWRILNLTPTKVRVFRYGVAIPVIPGYSQTLPLEPNEEGTVPSASGISAKIRCRSGKWVSAEVEPDTQNKNTLIIILPALGACK